MMSRATANTAVNWSSFSKLANSFLKLQSGMFSILLCSLLPTPPGLCTGCPRSWSPPTFLHPTNAHCPVSTMWALSWESGLKYLELEVSTHLVYQITLFKKTRSNSASKAKLTQEHLNKQCEAYLQFPLQYWQEPFEMEPQKRELLPYSAALAHVRVSCSQVTDWKLLSSLHEILGYEDGIHNSSLPWMDTAVGTAATVCLDSC